MAPENNWLSFSLSSMEMLQSTMNASSSADSHNYYSFPDNFYANGWAANPKAETMYTAEAETHQEKQSNLIFTSYIDSELQQNMQPPPKLEDFFGGESIETQDSSSLTQIYDHHHHHHNGGGASGASAYFNSSEPQDLKNITGFQAFSANSGSEVDDSAFVGQTQSPVESGSELVAYSRATTAMTGSGPATATTHALSLGVNNNVQCSEDNNVKAIVAVESDGCKKIADTFGQRTSIYRGVTRHRWTGRYEAHLWDNSCRREGQARKGRQVYLGGYDKEEKAARAYDLAALKYWGPTATTNFPISNYTKELEEMKHATKQEFIASLRRKSSGFSRGASIYRGVTRHHQQGRWQARIGRVAGNKDLYLGTFATEEEAAEAYDIAAIKFRGINAVTNFEMSRYDVEAIANSSLPIGGTAKRLKLSLEAEEKPPISLPCSGNTINFAGVQPVSSIPCGVPYETTAPFYHHNLFHPVHSSNGLASADTTIPVSSMVTPMPLMTSPMTSPAEFFIWPHQSY